MPQTQFLWTCTECKFEIVGLAILSHEDVISSTIPAPAHMDGLKFYPNEKGEKILCVHTFYHRHAEDPF